MRQTPKRRLQRRGNRGAVSVEGSGKDTEKKKNGLAVESERGGIDLLTNNNLLLGKEGRLRLHRKPRGRNAPMEG